MADATLEALSKAANGLLFPSETDEPFEAFVWQAAGNTAASVVRFAGLPQDDPCRAMTLAAFLGDLLEESDFRDLSARLEALLSAITVYRFGTVEPVYYIVGSDAAGRLAGLKTSAVET